MMRGHLGRVGGALFGCLALTFAQSAQADWRVPRADAQRTGTAEGLSNITEPAVYWRSFEGGRSTVRGLFDVAEGEASYAVISGGAVELHSNDQVAPLWRTANFGARSLPGKTDLNRDGVFELVVATSSSARVLDGETGATLWQVPDDLIGTIGTVRIADFTGDGVPELAVTECGCCGQRSGRTGFVWDFSASIANPSLVWEMPSIDCSADRSSVAFDSDGDGTQEWFAPRIDHFQLFEPAGAGLIAESDSITDRLVSYRSDCRAAQLDADPAEEIVCLYNDPLIPGPEGHRLYAMEFNPLTSSLDFMWQFDVGDKSTAVLSRSAIADVDGDGAVEVLVNGELADGTKVGYVLNGEDGSTVTERTGVEWSGVVRDGRLVLGSVDGNLSAFTLDGGTLDRVWRVTDRVVISQWVRQRGGVSGHLRRNPVVVGQDDDQQVLVRSGDGLTAELLTLPLNDNPQRTSLTLSDDGALGNGISSGNDLLWTDTRGYGFLTEEASSVDKKFELGGYYANAAPRTHGYSHAVGLMRINRAQRVVATDSSGALRVLDATDAGNAVPPQVNRSFANSRNPLLSEGGGGLVMLTKQLPLTDPQPYTLRLINNGFQVRWSFDIPARLQTDIMAGDLNDDGTDDYVAQWSDPANPELITVAINGRNGGELWTNTLPASSNQQPYGATLSDVNGDGALDVLVQYGSTRAFSGPDGEPLFESGTGGTYGTVTAFQSDDDAAQEYVVHGGFYERVVLDDDLTPLEALDEELPRVFVSGVVVQCTDEDAPRLFEPTANAPGTVETFDLRGPALGQLLSSWVYAGGERYATAADAINAGHDLAKLNSPSAHVNLTGSGTTAAVMGSEDGWLYAIDACDGDVLWSLEFDAPVGAVAFGDTDDDDLDEVIVSVADGYLYAIKQQAATAPATVVEAAADLQQDVDMLPAGEDLFLRWSLVEDADYYEVQLVDENGQSLRGGYEQFEAPPVVYAAQELTPGMSYRASVRAVVGEEVSPDVAGDSVTIVGAPVSSPPEAEFASPLGVPLAGGLASPSSVALNPEFASAAEVPFDVELALPAPAVSAAELGTPATAQQSSDDGGSGSADGDAPSASGGCSLSGTRNSGGSELAFAALGLSALLRRRRR